MTDILTPLINRITCADCMDVLKGLPDKCIDLIVTDPPYGIGVGKKTCIYDGKKHGNSKAHRAEYAEKSWDDQIPAKEIFDEMFRVAKNQIIFGGNYFVEYLKNSPCWIVWDKVNGDNDFADCELAWTSFSSAVRKYEFMWSGMLQQNMANKEVRIHPTQKPADLIGQIIRDYSKPEDIIMDPFSGSGSTAIACHRLGRQFICIEKDPEYADASSERLNEECQQLKLF